jgi:hypothetical protein
MPGTSLTRLQAVSSVQAKLLQLYDAKMWLTGALVSDSLEVLQARPGGQVFTTLDTSTLDFVNTNGRRPDENKAKYATAVTTAAETVSSTGWEQAAASHAC